MGKRKRDVELLLGQFSDAVTREAESPLPSPTTTGSNGEDQSLKRTRIAADEKCSLHEQQEPSSGDVPQPANESDHSVTHWVLSGTWPENMGQQDPSMPDAPPSKRRSSSTHRTQALERMAVHGINMESSILIRKESKELCNSYLDERYAAASTSVFSFEQFDKVLNRVQNLNEARIQRDVTPWVVPSAETLIIQGQLQQDWIGEELDCEWIRCAPLGSTTPKPDYTAGLRRDSFTKNEIAKLENYATSTRPFNFTPGLCFPFLVCEVKSGERGLNEAHRQNLHSASIAVRALVSLYQAAFGTTAPYRVQELFGQVLIFSVSHDNDMVYLYGHFAVADPTIENGLKFYRYPVKVCSLSVQDGADRMQPYNFVMNLYKKFAAEHRQRIKDAVAALPAVAPRAGLDLAYTESIMDPSNLEEDSQQASSQYDHVFAKPGESASTGQVREMAREMAKMKAQIDTLLEQGADAKRQLEQQNEVMALLKESRTV